MIGLFWITEESVHLGAEPEGQGRGVRLTPEGLKAVGADQRGSWAWADVRAVDVHHVQVRASTGWLMHSVADTVLDLGAGIGEAPPPFELHVRTATDETAELTVHCAVPGGYVQSEYELSLELLHRFVDGTADVARLLEWGRAEGGGTTPWRPAREALLRSWATT
ncbi:MULTISPECIES: hypothetical protein [unclassified Streptomyces]|uniref:hypothetical protein n=1 Tax=unclassified Streptomyces TaxID=2593676 RepID=UPI002E81D388|nr:hypothetical protein [Streptomyces sp. NBC_00589]WTI42655.1 hypothetical protein OIC96_22815 [Streptomyces sp. NBC_00775]WUB33127.1 hypothetical protein OHA51_26920 [Streptomyces sp. NBC_00589]